MTASSTVAWFSPICDHILLKVYQWWKYYQNGIEAASRPQVAMNGQIVDVITKRAHKIPFNQPELSHLVRLMGETGVNPTLVEDFQRVQAGLLKGKLLPGGMRLMEMVFYKQDVEEILIGLLRAKTGKLVTLDDIAAQQKAEGKDLFEV